MIHVAFTPTVSAVEEGIDATRCGVLEHISFVEPRGPDRCSRADRLDQVPDTTRCRLAVAAHMGEANPDLDKVVECGSRLVPARACRSIHSSSEGEPSSPLSFAPPAQRDTLTANRTRRRRVGRDLDDILELRNSYRRLQGQELL
jgi:hypothetical protein